MRRSKLIAFNLIYAILLILFFEFSLRAFYAILYGNPETLLRPYSIADRFYPGVRESNAEPIAEDNGDIDILMLGGSVLHPDWSSIEQQLRQKLTAEYDCKINIDNFAVPAHTSLDSRIKYGILKNQHYDIVLLYHGINEVRFNNCPEEVFEEDYTHIEFYSFAYPLTYELSRYSILPYVVSFMQRKLSRHELVSRYLVENEEWLQYGQNIKTVSSFMGNYDEIIQMAIRQNTTVILPSFAYYIPDKYSHAAFEEKKLDYVAHKTPISLWGRPEAVEKGVVAHNLAIKKCSRQYEGSLVHYLDLNSTIPKAGKYFDDICHLSEVGSAAYVAELYPLVQEIIEERQSFFTE